MAVMDEFREEREAIKNGTRQQKYQYFKDYYRTPLLIALVACIIIGAFIFQVLTNKEQAFLGVFLNCSPNADNQWFKEEFAEQAKISLDEYDVMFDTSAGFNLNFFDEQSQTTVQKVSTYFSVGDLDVLLGTGQEFAYYSTGGTFADLRKVLTDEQIKKYEPYFYYIDETEMGLVSNAIINETLETLEISDPKDPASMQKPIPVGIYVESSSKLNEAYSFRNAEDGIVIGILSNTPHLESTQAFIDYLMAE